RSLTFEINERIMSDGEILEPINELQVRRQIERLKDLQVEAVGVCLLWSPINSTHEEAVGALLSAYAPGIEVTLSHRLSSTIREYRRASATVIDASIKGLMRSHLTEVDQRLRGIGFDGDPLMVTHVSGGVLTLHEMCAKPL